MKIAEALNLRADLQKQVEQLKERLNVNMQVQEGDKPAEQPEVLFQTLDELIPQLEDLIVRINLTNTRTIVDGKSLTAMLARKDVLKIKLDAYRAAYSSAVIKADRYSRNEIRFIPTVKGEDLQKKIDKMSKEYRELDMKIQQANWATNLEQ